ncbi:MAG: hypothetical protein ABFD76_05190 [Smithella sp.]
MNGKKLTQWFLDDVNQPAVDDNYASQRKIYECLDIAAGIYCRETRALKTTCTLTTVAGQQEYNLPPDFIDLYMKDNRGRFFAKYYDAVNYTWPILDSHERLFRENLTDSRDYPSYFAIKEPTAPPALINGTATAVGAVTNGRCILEDSTKLFLTTHKVYPRDIIYNTTDGSLGIVLSVIDATHLYCALFGGTGNDWTLSDAYTIQPATERAIVLCAPSLTSGHTITVPYVCMPAPVYWDFGLWNLPARTCRAIASGAASLFKLPQSEYIESQALGKLFDEEVKQYKVELGRKALQQGPSRRRERL